MAAFLRCTDADKKVHFLNLDHVVRVVVDQAGVDGESPSLPSRVSIYMTPVGSNPAPRVITEDSFTIAVIAQHMVNFGSINREVADYIERGVAVTSAAD